MHGVGMRDRTSFSKDSLQVAPFILTPSSFPRAEFHKAVQLQTILNELMHKVAHDAEFLQQTLANALQVDEFTAGLYTIWEKVQAEGVAQSLNLGLFRSDYLMQAGEHSGIKQVEINTVASSFGGIATVLNDYYSYVLGQLGHADKLKDMPENMALQGLCGGIIEAFDLYGTPEATVMFVVEDVTINICDQRFHEFEIAARRPDIRVLRKTLTEIYHESQLNDKMHLVIEGSPVAVVYYRSGYEPAQYHGGNEWEARLRVERSNAIKCPSIQYQLAGTKKVQQALASPRALERFIPDTERAEQVREIFTGLYALDFDQDGEEVVEMALRDAERFVLKPQREGGGNNVYGADIREALQRMRQSRERAAYILMERIAPPRVAGYMVRPGQDPETPLVDLVSELGIFGVIIGTNEKILVNRQVGHMLRTKLAEADEGGVAAGLGALDSPYLIDT